MTLRSKTMMGVLAAVLLVALLVGWAHLQTKAQWAAYHRQLRAAGEKLTIAENIPLPPTGGVNSASALLWACDQLGSLPPTSHPPMMKILRPGRACAVWKLPELVTREHTNLWSTLGAAIEAKRDHLVALRMAVDDAILDFSPNYQAGLVNLRLAHLAKLKGAAQWLAAATLFDLHEGQVSDAFADLRALTVLAHRGGGDEPILISQLVHVAESSIALGATWEALQYSGWSDAQYAELHAAWQNTAFLLPMERSLSMERAMAADFYQQARRSPSMLRSQLDLCGCADSSLDGVLETARTLSAYTAHYLFWPWWWSYQDELWYAQRMQIHLDTCRQAMKSGAFIPARHSASNACERMGPVDLRFPISATMSSSFTSTISKAAMMEAQRQLLLTALALKRYHARHGQHPPALSALVPEFLSQRPLDFMDGQPLRYRLQPDGAYLLYSVGEDGVDQGGDPAPADKSLTGWLRGRDLVWPQPAAEEDIAADRAKLEKERARRRK